MSKADADHFLKKLLTETLKNVDFRATSAQKISYLVVSKVDIARASRLSPNDPDYEKSYTEYMTELNKILTDKKVNLKYNNANDAVNAILSGTRVTYAGVSAADVLYIFGRNYDALGRLRNEVANAMPADKIFGLSDKDTLTARVSKKASQAYLKNYFGQFFILRYLSGKRDYIIHEVTKNKKSIYIVTPRKELGVFTHFVKKDKLGNINTPEEPFLGSLANGAKVYINKGSIEKTESGALVLDTQYLPLQHLGHIENAATADLGTKTVSGEKFSSALAIIATHSQDIYVQQLKSIIEDGKKKLSALHGQFNYSFLNELPKIFNGEKLTTGVTALIIQLESVNTGTLAQNALSPFEASIMANVVKDMTAAVEKFGIDVPGSNSLRQDLFQSINNAIVSILSGEPVKKLKPHAKITGKLNLPVKFPVVKIQALGGSGKSKSSSTKEKTSSSRPIQLRTITGQFYGLVPLQRLLDATLVQRVKDNMGTGSRRDILNLRTGRFAESVKVENLSQSREGMITAFYSYMRNPYATFSTGGRQEFPKSRDPKLLIAKSIREIGATMVGNRMRAVLV
jgi:hypothetical protein